MPVDRYAQRGQQVQVVGAAQGGQQQEQIVGAAQDGQQQVQVVGAAQCAAYRGQQPVNQQPINQQGHVDDQ